jgi:hypothetical protein
VDRKGKWKTGKKRINGKGEKEKKSVPAILVGLLDPGRW